MPPIPKTQRGLNLRGSLWMIVAMAGFAAEDTCLKLASQTLPLGQILILFGLGGVLVFGAFLLRHQTPFFIPEVMSRPMQLRFACESSGRLFYLLAITLTPLSAATVILQATPLVVVAGAAVVFGEKVGWRRWAAIFIGLIGVMIILQPGSEQFSALSVFAILGMLGFAGRDLASRAAPAALGTWHLGFYGFWAVIVAGFAFSLWQGVPFVLPSLTGFFAVLGAIASGTAAYACLMLAMRTGEVAAVTPFRYTRLIFGIALGVVIFEEQLSLAMIAGAALIVLSGLFTLVRSRAKPLA